MFSFDIWILYSWQSNMHAWENDNLCLLSMLFKITTEIYVWKIQELFYRRKNIPLNFQVSHFNIKVNKCFQLNSCTDKSKKTEFEKKYVNKKNRRWWLNKPVFSYHFSYRYTFLLAAWKWGKYVKMWNSVTAESD